ncbi:hypothetical protein INT47_011932 [Mucor saturninus]|uniref:Peptidase A2 domain-containing protein n=1 Tax=Mucor saturninus TaxID=64648 RepID=A0A8H7QFI9_9FUNG|nr:hypothetical protein INT47_011932 [Mucor saturninus]
MQQAQGESPQVFLSRLFEAADLADIQEEKLIHSRFRAGLLPALRTFCHEQSASSFDQWVKHADGWWNAHAPTPINLVKNPFVSAPAYSYSSGISHVNKSENEKSVRFLNDRVSTLKNIDGKTHKSNTKAYASEESPTMTALTAKLEVLDLHQLIPLMDSNETTHENVKQSMADSWKTDKGLKTFIKNIVQKVVETINSYQKNDYYFDNDAASPAEGYYIFRQYKQDNRPRNNYNDYYNNRNSYHPSGKRPHAYNQYHDHKKYPQPFYINQKPYDYSDNAHQGQPPSNHNPQQKGHQYQPGSPSNQNSHANNGSNTVQSYLNKDNSKYSNNYQNGPQQNGQLAEPNFYQKSNQITTQQLNLLNNDLYAVRLSAPSKVNIAPLSELTKTPQKNNLEPMDTDTYDAPGPSTLITQPYQPIALKAPILTNQAINLPTRENIIHNIDSNGNIVKNIKYNKTKIRRKITPLSERIAYDIMEDVLNRKVDVNVKDLLIAAPSQKKDLVKSVREKTKKTDPISLTLAFAEDDDVDTTAIYTEVYIGQFKIKAILDTGSAKTQAALGLIYDLIIGNNWLKRAKAKLNLEEKSQATKYTYADQINTVQNTPIGLVNLIVDNDTSEESDGNVSEKSDESDELLPESSDEESTADLYILEDTYGETSKIEKNDIIYMENDPEVPDNYLIKLQSAIYLSPYYKTNEPIHSTWQPASSYLKHNQDVLTIYLINNSDSTIELSAQEIIGELDVLNVDDIEEMECYRERKPTEEDFFHIEEVHDTPKGTMIEYEEKLSNKIDLTNVPTKIKQAYVKMMYNFDHIFDWNNDKIGNIDIMEHTIKLKSDAIPKRIRPYRISPLETESLKKELDKLLKLGIIEKGGYSNWLSLIIMLKKKDGSYRIVADFRY